MGLSEGQCDAFLWFFFQSLDKTGLSSPRDVTLWYGSSSFLWKYTSVFLTTRSLGILTTAFGAITLGSKTAFSDLAGSFVILSSTSYVLCILPNALTGRRYIPRGYFWMGRAGMFVNVIASVFIIFFNIMFCFRKSPTLYSKLAMACANTSFSQPLRTLQPSLL